MHDPPSAQIMRACGCRYIRDCPVNSDTYNSARIAAGTAARVAAAVATKEVLNGAAIGESAHCRMHITSFASSVSSAILQ